MADKRTTYIYFRSNSTTLSLLKILPSWRFLHSAFLEMHWNCNEKLDFGQSRLQYRRWFTFKKDVKFSLLENSCYIAAIGAQRAFFYIDARLEIIEQLHGPDAVTPVQSLPLLRCKYFRFLILQKVVFLCCLWKWCTLRSRKKLLDALVSAGASMSRFSRPQAWIIFWENIQHHLLFG